MTIENLSQEEHFNKRRIEYASSMLDPYWLTQYIGFDTQFSDKQLPDFIEWNKSTNLGEGNMYIDGVLLGRYFKSQEEFIESCMNTKDDQIPLQVFRDFNDKLDADQFSIDSQKYSAIKVFRDGSIALAGFNDAEGNFSIDVYPSKDLKKGILQNFIEIVQHNIDKDQVKINKSQNRINNFKLQLEHLK